MKRKTERKIRLFIIMGMAVLFAVLGSCEMFVDMEYTFDNQTQYYITVSLNKAYKLSKGAEDETWLNDDLSLYSKSSKTVYIDADNVNFEWTASSSGNNRYIYPENSGSKVTFKERGK